MDCLRGIGRAPLKYGLPIDEALPALETALQTSRSVVLQAPPGAGKSTVVPLFLLQQPWLAGRRILLIEPRRLAARAVAQRMAQTLQESPGQTVGWRMRLDTRVSRETRIEVVTEGILTRMLQSDPSLSTVGAVLFDEFHERNLQSDLGLALAADARRHLREDLRILVMSATLDGAAVANLLGGAPIVTAQGRAHPIEIRYIGKGSPPLGQSLSGSPADSAERQTARAVMRALQEESGDILVFLPGAREIQRVQSFLESGELDPNVRVLPLSGELSVEAQDAALAPAGAGLRKVVLATNVAETSLTIGGMRVVVDSGLVRRSVFDPGTGMSRLETLRISRASAEQRAGRAGRVEPGVCYRLWSEAAHRSLAPFTPPEILETDLAPLALELAVWGTAAAQLDWLDPPPAALLGSARDLLRSLEALNDSYQITDHGRRMAQLGAHPRLAHMLIRAARTGEAAAAADLAALLSERDLLQGTSVRNDADIRTRLELLRGEQVLEEVDRWRLRRVQRVARDLTRQVEAQQGAIAQQVESQRYARGGAHGRLLSLAFPDRIGRRREGSERRYTLTNGRGAYFTEPQSVAAEPFIVAVSLDDRERDARILLAAAVSQTDIERQFADRLECVESVEWSSREQAVIARRVVRLGELVLDERPVARVGAEETRRGIMRGILEMGLEALPWDRASRDLQARMLFVRRLAKDRDTAEASWPDVSDAALSGSLELWLGPWLDGMTRREHLARLSLTDALGSLLSWDQRRRLDELAPTHLKVPSGSSVRIDYLEDSAPSVAVRLQEVFGLHATPLIGQGRVPVTFKLLSPAQRPVQVTRDLASFWRGAYAEVRKDLRGRYPKHYWPENPLEAEALRGTRRRGNKSPGS